MIHFVVAEDCLSILEQIISTIESTMMKNQDIPFQISSVSSKEEILPFIQNDDLKVYILDFELQDCNSLELVRMIREEKSDWESILLILSIRDELRYQLLSLRLLIFDYISLYQDNAFSLLASDLQQIASIIQQRRKTLLIATPQELYRISCDDILYITRDTFQRKSVIVTKTDSIFTRETLSELKKSLPSYFFQVQRSFIVNVHEVSSVNFSENAILLSDGKVKIWFSRRYAKKLREKMVEDCQN